jgi:hypothetical protein
MTSPLSAKRTCPWCGDAEIYAVSDAAVLRALTAHLESCTGPESQHVELTNPAERS